MVRLKNRSPAVAVVLFTGIVGCGLSPDQSRLGSAKQRLNADCFITNVVSFTPGRNAGFGQDRMPQVVFGPPVGTGDLFGSFDVVSLGDEGEIIVELGRYIVDGPGPDFIVFENPFNIGGDYNMDGVTNDHPVFTGSSLNSVYSGGSPADGIFKDNNRIGCGFPGMPSNISTSVSSSSCPSTGNSLFANPAYPSGSTPYLRFGTLGRDIFHGPKFVQMDLGLSKTFKLTEGTKLDFRFQAQNLTNHPNFDCVDSNLSSTTFGQAQCLIPFGLGAPKSRVMSLGLRLAF